MICPTCGSSAVEIDDVLPDGSIIGVCTNCDGHPKKEHVYINHCWNCKGPIDSRVDQLSSRANKGYICRRCGYDLQGPALRAL